MEPSMDRGAHHGSWRGLVVSISPRPTFAGTSRMAPRLLVLTTSRSGLLGEAVEV